MNMQVVLPDEALVRCVEEPVGAGLCQVTVFRLTLEGDSGEGIALSFAKIMRAGRTGIDDHVDHHAVVPLWVEVERLVETVRAHAGGQQYQQRNKSRQTG